MINTYANYMRLVKELEQEQTSHAETRKLLLKACNERDDAEQALSHAYYLITGKSPEWSNLFGHAEALEEIDTAQYLLRTEIASFKRLEREQETELMPHDDLDKMRGEVDAAIRDCYLALGMGENVAFRALRKAVADRLTKKATPEPVAPALDYKNSMRGQINAREHPDGAQRRATAPEPVPQQDDADVKEAKAQLVSCMMDAYFEASREPYSYPPNKVKGMTAALDIVLHKSCGFYDALDKHVRNGVIAAAVDIGRHHQELIRMSEKEAYADTTGEISPQEKASQLPPAPTVAPR